jgi:hypothetical protein
MSTGSSFPQIVHVGSLTAWVAVRLRAAATLKRIAIRFSRPS